MLTANVSSYSFTRRIPKFILDFESEAKDDNTFYKDYTFSHYDYNKAEGRIQYPKQTASHPVSSRKQYEQKVVATFTVNVLPAVGKVQQVNITQIDLEYKKDCSYDSLTFLNPAKQNGTSYSLTQRGRKHSNYRWVVLNIILCRITKSVLGDVIQFQRVSN
jgi:hypothetical protein